MHAVICGEDAAAADKFGRARFLFQVLLHGAVVSVMLLLVFRVCQDLALADAQKSASNMLNMEVYNLQSTLEHFRYLPQVLSVNEDIEELLLEPRNERLVTRVNDTLAKLNDAAHTDVIYVMNISGEVLVASNWNTPGSFVGHNYQFRPYFTTALEGHAAYLFAIGTTTGKPGYFLSAPLFHDGRVIGVLVVKVPLENLERGWREGGANIFVSDVHGVSFLAAQSQFRYKTSHPLSASAAEAIHKSRQYADEPLSPLPLEIVDSTHDYQIVRQASDGGGLLGNRFLLLERAISAHEWTMSQLVDISPPSRSLLTAMLAATLGYFLVVQGAYYLLLRVRTIRHKLENRAVLEKLNTDLELRIVERTSALILSNKNLQGEIVQHVQTEAKLRQTRNELANASKLVALGQMAAGVAHEINQPLTAMRGFAGNTVLLMERQQYDAAAANLKRICGLLEHIARLTSDLKNFSRQNRGEGGQASLGQTIRETLILFDVVLQQLEAQLELVLPAESFLVKCDAVGLEQVFGNLICNAIDAIAQSEVRRISIRVESLDSVAMVVIADSGCGIPNADLNHIFEPFFTTKQRGKGLGLGLSIVSNIVHEAQGSISAANGPDGGAVFTLYLPLVRPLQETTL